MHRRRILMTGCSGGGKSTLLNALAGRGVQIVPEPGRRIIAAEQAGDGRALPWVDPAAFAERALAMAIDDFKRVGAGTTVFDRGIVDARVALDHAAGRPPSAVLAQDCRYDDPVLLVPPWPEIYVADPDRRHGLAEAIAEYDRLHRALTWLGHEIVMVAPAPVAERVAQVSAALGC